MMNAELSHSEVITPKIYPRRLVRLLELPTTPVRDQFDNIF